VIGVDELRDLPDSHAVVFAGDLARIAFPELVSVIVHGRISGVLRVYGSSATRTVVFSAGEVRGAYSDRASERLGEIAVRLGLVKREDIDDLTEAGVDPRRAGRIAVERRLLSERELWNAVQEHVTTVFQAILLETRGAFVLTDERYDDTLTVPGLSAEGLLMEGVRRLDELRVLRSGGGRRARARARRVQRGVPRHLRDRRGRGRGRGAAPLVGERVRRRSRPRRVSDAALHARRRAAGRNA